MNLGTQFADKWLMNFNDHARVSAEMSKDTTKVGAVLIGPDKEILLSTYNGPPIGVQDSDFKFSRENGAKYRFASHAEQNLIAFAARRGIRTDGLRVFCTHNPCPSCTRSLIQAGIREIRYNSDNSFVSDSEDDRKAVQIMCEEADVWLEGTSFTEVMDRVMKNIDFEAV